jgi:cell division protein FtsL
MITTRIMARTTPIRVAYVKEARLTGRLSIVGMLLACLALVLIFSFLSSAHQEAREQLLEKLQSEKQTLELNKTLKMELAAITQKRYLEHAAKERLGLKRPAEAEVVVLR